MKTLEERIDALEERVRALESRSSDETRLLDGALERQRLERKRAWRGSPEHPCEECGNIDTGSTRDQKGFMRCNRCGYPSP